MTRIHRIVLGVVVGAAAVLGVAALATTADLGAGGGSSAEAAPLALTTPAGTALDPDAAWRELQAARAELRRAQAEAEAARSAAPRVVTVPAAAAAPTYRDDDEYGDDDHEYGDDDHGYGDDDHGDDDHGDDDHGDDD